MGSVQLMRAAERTLLVASGACALAALWPPVPGPWYAWLGTAAVALVTSAAVSNAADDAERTFGVAQLKDALRSDDTCRARSPLNPQWVCVRTRHPHDAGAHYFVKLGRL